LNKIPEEAKKKIARSVGATPFYWLSAIELRSDDDRPVLLTVLLTSAKKNWQI